MRRTGKYPGKGSGKKSGSAVRGLGFWCFAGWLWMAGALTAGAESGDAGTESPFMLGTEARALGLARAYTAIADDASAVYWNPASLAHLQRKEITSLYIPLYDSTDYAFLAFAYPLSRQETLAAGLMALSVRDIPRRDEYNTDLGHLYDLQLQFYLSYARQIWKHWYAGANVKLYQHTLDNYNATGVGLDAGLYYRADDWLTGLTFGLNAANALPPRLTLVSVAESYPLNVRLGAAYQAGLDWVGNHALLGSVEGEKSEFAGFKLHAGLEYQGWKQFFLRVGWDDGRISAGAGLLLWDWRLDYAIRPMEAVGPMHVFSLGLRFGPTLDEEAAERQREILSALSQAKADEHNLRGLSALRQKAYSQAIDEFKEALRWEEDLPDAKQNLLAAQEALAGEELARRYQEGQKAFERKAYLEAIAVWQEVARQDAAYGNARQRIEIARKAMEQQWMRRAAPVRKSASRKVLAGQSWFEKGTRHYAEGEYQLAIQNWQQALEANPRLTAASEFISKARELIARSAPAKETEKTARLSGPQQARCRELYAQGILLYRQRKFLQARDAWDNVLKIDPTDKEAQRGVERIEAILRVFKERGLQ